MWKHYVLRFDKLYGVIKIYGETRYLESFSSWFCHRNYDRINYLIDEKSNYNYCINNSFAKIRFDSYNSFPIEKKTFHNVIILIKSVVNKNKYNYYFNTILEKG